MLELSRTHTDVVRLLARPGILDAFPPIPGRYACRVAPDELMLVGSGEAIESPEALVVDESGGWTALTLAGEDSPEAFARLTAIPLRPGFHQGTIAGVPGKAIVRNGRIHLLAVASLGHHLEERIRAVCSDLLPTAPPAGDR